MTAPLYAVFGHPIAHSRSPFIHARFGEQTGIALRYLAIDAPPEQFMEILWDFREVGGRGANVTLPLNVSGRTADPHALAELLAWVGLRAQSTALPPQLSGGARQRAALARAVMMSPDVILADEPTGNLDWDMSLRLLNLLVELNRMGKTVVIATHDLNLIRAANSQIAARVLRIANRRLQLAGADL